MEQGQARWAKAPFQLRWCDLVGLKVRDVYHADQLASRAVVILHKPQRPVQFEITPAALDAVQA